MIVMDIWQFQTTLTRRLLIWSLFSMISGALLQISRGRFARGLGQQFAAWGFINALIALLGQRATRKRAAQLTDPLAPEITIREAQKLQQILWINTGLDVGYMTGGAALALSKGKSDLGWRGHGLGVIIQGGFLFIFDLLHALKIGNSNR